MSRKLITIAIMALPALLLTALLLAGRLPYGDGLPAVGHSPAHAAAPQASALLPASIAPTQGRVPAAGHPADAPAHAQADDPFVIKRVLPIDGPIKYGEWHWDDEGVPAGPLRITVDLQARVISVFRAGYEIGAAAALLGTPDHPTPIGTFPILGRERHNVSEKYGNAPMPWTLRLTHDGVAIHGGSNVALGYASHGCVAVPDEFASRLFDTAAIGDIVIITNGQMTGIGGSLAAG